MKEKLKAIWKKVCTRETITYLVFGALTTAVNFLVTFLLMKAPFMEAWGSAIHDSAWFQNLTNVQWLNQFHNLEASGITFLVINIIAWFAAVVFAFITNKLFVFNSRSWKPSILFPEFGGFMAARILSLVFEEVFLFVTVTLCGMNEFIAKILAGIFVIIMNYFASKLFIFKKGSQKGDPNVSENQDEN